MDEKTHIPHPALQKFVLNISTVNTFLGEGIREVVTPYPPTPFQSLIFYCENPVSIGQIGSEEFEKSPSALLIGPQVSRVNIRLSKQSNGIRVDFLPGGMFRMLGIPMSELFDKGFDAVDLFGVKMKKLNERLQPISDQEKAITLVEKFLLDQIVGSKEILPIDFALHKLLLSKGNIPIHKLASLSCMSIKQLERKCRERIGMNPKLYARILRFSKAYRLHEAYPTLSWLDIAYKAGYYDQMHMIRDFKIFAGVNPSVIKHQLLQTPLRMQKNLRY